MTKSRIGIPEKAEGGIREKQESFTSFLLFLLVSQDPWWRLNLRVGCACFGTVPFWRLYRKCLAGQDANSASIHPEMLRDR